ncbi:hypothetical protein ACE1MS_11825 [Lysinibacillus sp. fkY74-1]
MNYTERLELLMIMKQKKIKMTELAKELNCSISWCSQFFSDKVGWNEETIAKAKHYIMNK